MKKLLKPNTRTIRRLRAEGWLCDLTERRTGPVTHDWLGAADVVAVHPDHGVLAVQATSRTNVSARVRKLEAAEEVLQVLRQCGVAIQVWGWDEKPDPRVVDLS